MKASNGDAGGGLLYLKSLLLFLPFPKLFLYWKQKEEELGIEREENNLWVAQCYRPPVNTCTRERKEI